MNNLKSFIAGSLTTSFILWWAVSCAHLTSPLISVLIADMIVLGLLLILFTKNEKKVKRK